MNIEVLLEELYSYSMHGIKLGLKNIQDICNAMGNPEKDYKIIHIAGTNGKGSTSTTVERVLLENGDRVGKYTSPHILRFNERICANGIEISNDDVAYYYSYVKDVIGKLGISPTFFEVTTAMMFKYFSDKKMDYVVLEVGLGGKYDATNIADSYIACVTNVSLDHTEFLGNSIYEIAQEKAGIIKENSKVIVGSLNEDFLRGIEEKKENYTNVLKKYANAKYTLDFKDFITRIDIDGDIYEYSLFGEYQYKNFLCAFEIVRELGVSKDVIKRAVKDVFWQCRFEVLKKNKTIILDGAHNGEGAKTLCETLEKGYKKDEIVAIVSILKDKDINEVVKVLEKSVGDIIFTSLKDNKRGLSGEELFNMSLSKSGKTYEENLKKAYTEALKMKNKKIILICGSFYLLSKLKEEVLPYEV